VIEARYVFHSIAPPPGHDDVPVGMEYLGSGWGEASGRGVLRCCGKSWRNSEVEFIDHTPSLGIEY